MSDNPYMLGGFGEGFTRGLELAWKSHDRQVAEEDRQRQYRLQEEELGQRKQLFGLQLEKGQQDVELGKLSLEEAKAKAPFAADAVKAQAAAHRGQAAESRAKAGLYEEQTAAAKGYRKASEAQAKMEELNRKFGEHIADQIEDPQWIERGRLVDDIINGGQANENTLNQHKGDIMSWLDQTAKPIWDETVGKPLSEPVAKAQGLDPKKAKILEVHPVDIHVHNERGTAVFELQVTATDGNKTVVYNAPMTENRTSDPKDFVKEIPLWKLEKMAQAGGMFAHIADEAGQQGKSPSDVRAWIKGQLANPVKGHTSAAKVPAQIQVIQKYGDTKFKNEPDADKRYQMAADELSKRVDYQKITNRVNAIMANDNSDPPLTYEQARQMAEEEAYGKAAGGEEEEVIDVYMPGAEPQ